MSCGSRGLISAAIASTTYVYSASFPYPGYLLKELFVQLHPTLITPFFPQFLWNISSVPKKKKLVLICKFFCSQIHLYVSACVFWISIKILSSLWAWTISCSCLVLFSLSADYNVRHKIRTPLSIWWLVVKRIKEKGQPGVMYVLASGKYSSKKVLFLCSSAFYYRKQ